MAAPSAPRRRLDAAARRESILRAAIPAFAEAGYDRTRVADIAARVGVSEPVVFQNFGTKADLFVAVLDRVADEAAGFLGGLGESAHDLADVLALMLQPELHEQVHTAGGLGVLFAEAMHRGEPPIREAAHRANDRVAQGIAAILRRGQAEGSVRDDVSPSALAWLLLSEVHARELRRMHVAEWSPALEHAVSHALVAVLRGATG